MGFQQHPATDEIFEFWALEAEEDGHHHVCLHAYLCSQHQIHEPSTYSNISNPEIL
jgi:hypothetical protein